MTRTGRWLPTGRIPKSQLGQTSIYLPVEGSVRNGAAIACLRNHDVKVRMEPGERTIPASITHVNSAGSVVRVELERADDKSRIVAELSRERLVPALHPGASVFVELENPRIFPDDALHPSTTATPTSDTPRTLDPKLVN